MMFKCDIDDTKEHYNLEFISRIYAVLEKKSYESICTKREAGEIKLIKIYFERKNLNIQRKFIFISSEERWAIFYSKSGLFLN